MNFVVQIEFRVSKFSFPDIEVRMVLKVGQVRSRLKCPGNPHKMTTTDENRDHKRDFMTFTWFETKA